MVASMHALRGSYPRFHKRHKAELTPANPCWIPYPLSPWPPCKFPQTLRKASQDPKKTLTWKRMAAATAATRSGLARGASAVRVMAMRSRRCSRRGPSSGLNVAMSRGRHLQTHARRPSGLRSQMPFRPTVGWRCVGALRCGCERFAVRWGPRGLNSGGSVGGS